MLTLKEILTIKIANYFACILNQSPIMDPSEFENMCKDIGAEKLFYLLCDIMSSDRMFNERKQLIQLHSMVVIYVMIYSRSQKNNWFQITLARTLQQFGISEVVEKEYFLVFCIDDYHNIHTKHRPENKTQTQAVLTHDNIIGKGFPKY